MRAFTLVELVISLGIMSVLAAGISSAILVSIRAVETPRSQSARVRQACDVSNQMMAELSEALDVSDRSARAIAFSVPDRDNDGSSEEIRYAWSGVAGAQLIRYFNGEPGTAILDAVHAFNLGYELVPIQVISEPQDQIVSAYSSSSDLGNIKITSAQWISQAFTAKLPSGATGWKPTRAVLHCRTAGALDGRFQLQLRNVLYDGRPGSWIYCETPALESELQSSFTWASFDLDYAGTFSPGTTVALVVKASNHDACELRYRKKNVSLEGSSLYVTTNSGWQWNLYWKQAVLFEIHGQVVGVSGNASPEMRLGIVRWELQVGPDSATRINAGAQLANLPE